MCDQSSFTHTHQIISFCLCANERVLCAEELAMGSLIFSRKTSVKSVEDRGIHCTLHVLSLASMQIIQKAILNMANATGINRIALLSNWSPQYI